MPESAATPVLEEVPLERLAACPECDLLMLKPELSLGQVAECPRCSCELFRLRHRIVGPGLALVLAALLLYFPANFLPIMRLNLLGRVTDDTVWSGVLSLYSSGMQGVAVVVFLCSMAVPLLKLLCQLAVLLCIALDRAKPLGMLLYRTYHHLREWGMLEVYLLGILVSIIKLRDMAELSLGIGLGCFVGLLVVQVWLELVMSPHQVWEALSERRDARC
ncbi:paraquat-inducible protein A [Pseudomonas kunmingensis]|uniref:paraquat-inducible protein A n=1 Tax=Stutzerimonas kunmingensis TaxID=1211807 RepID=UPI0015E2A0B3|nr:paraquat-inducible protein A [Stutzerimonas kunmingensis]MBA1239738.1 paraquat-inducible protein A [Stutzerimonas kunmingensis]MDH2248437.1 paraquat-inducible protein A [Pseudomonas sp. GD03856]MDH2267224.1 paraquat-inducible protein A [Pseudomonas sp. GD03855]